MKKYEIVIITNKKNIKFLKKLNIKNNIENLGEKKLAYEIKKNNKANYIRINLSAKYKKKILKIKKLLSSCKSIIRFIILLKKKNVRIVFKKKKFYLNYLDKKNMCNFIDENKKIISSNKTGLIKKHQKKVSKYIKISRFLSIISYS